MRTLIATIKYCGFFLTICLILISSVAQIKIAVNAVLFIPQVVPDIPFRPLELVSRQPSRESIIFSTTEGPAVADLYLPAGSRQHSAVLFFMGVVPPNRDEQRIVSLAEGLARTGMVVMIPWLDTQNEHKIIKVDIERLVGAYQYLRNHERVKPNKVGMGGICTGASMVVIAAEDERINEQVAFINSFAGYYDATDFVASVATNRHLTEFGEFTWKPDELTIRVLFTHLIDGVPEAERELLRNLFDNGKWDSHETENLSDYGRAVSELIMGASVETVFETINRLSPETLQFLEDISPSSHIRNLKSDVFIMHDRADRLVPYDESSRFAQAIQDENGHVYHTEFSMFQNAVQVHMSETDDLGLIGFINELFKLYKHMYQIMSLAE